MLKNDSLLGKIGADTAENEPRKECYVPTAGSAADPSLPFGVDEVCPERLLRLPLVPRSLLGGVRCGGEPGRSAERHEVPRDEAPLDGSI